MQLVTPSETARAAPRPWRAVAAISLGIFLVVTAEELPIGLLTMIATDMGVPVGMTGLTITLPGIVAGLAAPAVAMAGGLRDRRLILAALLTLLATASLVAAVSSGFWMLLLSRLFVGFVIGGFWAIAGGIAPRLVPEAQVAKATSIIFGGVAAAAVLGVPAGTLLGNWLGWRAAFGLLAAASLMLSLALVATLPRLPGQQAIKLGTLAAQLRSRPVVAVLLATLLVVTAQFTSFSYVSPIAQSLMEVPIDWIGVLLLGYGVAGIAGNFIAGALSDRRPAFTILALTALLATLTLLVATIVRGQAIGVVAILGWGLAFGGVSVTLQTWLLKVASDNPEAGTALMVGIFSLSIAVGAYVGGVLFDGLGMVPVLLVSSILFVLAVPVIISGHRSLPDAPRKACPAAS